MGGDHDLTRLEEAWPRLRTLRLVTTLQGVVSSAALVAFAQYCPRLHTLHLRGVEFRDTMVDWLIIPPPVRNHGLCELSVCRPPPFDDSYAVVSFMRIVFPNVLIAKPTCWDECAHLEYHGAANMSPVARMLEQGEFPDDSSSDGSYRSD